MPIDPTAVPNVPTATTVQTTTPAPVPPATTPASTTTPPVTGIPEPVKAPVAAGTDLTNGATPPATAPATPTIPPAAPNVGPADVNKSFEDSTKATAEYADRLKTELAKGVEPTQAEKDKAAADAEATKSASDAILKQKEAAALDYETESKKLLQEQATQEAQAAKDQAVIDQQRLEAKAATEKAAFDADMLKAKTDVEIQQSMSALAMQKLGLTHSGSSVAAFQQIATMGITKLAQISAEYASKNLEFQLQAKESTNKLTASLNKIVYDSSSNILKIKKETKDELADIQNSLLKTEKEKKDEIERVLDKRRKEHEDAQDRTVRLAKSASDLAIDEADRIKRAADARKAEALKNANTLAETGAWGHLTPEQKAQYEMSAGLPAGSLDKSVENQNAKDMNNIIDKVVGSSYYYPDGNTLKAFNAKANQLMANGMGREMAVNIAFGQTVAQDPKYVKAVNSKKPAGKSPASPKPIDPSKFVNVGGNVGFFREDGTFVKATDDSRFAGQVSDAWDKKGNIPTNTVVVKGDDGVYHTIDKSQVGPTDVAVPQKTSTFDQINALLNPGGQGGGSSSGGGSESPANMSVAPAESSGWSWTNPFGM